MDALIAPSLTLALFVTALGGSPFLVGLLSAIYNGGWFIPQFLVSHRLQQLPLKRPVYQIAAYVRIVCWLLIVIATFTLGAQNPTLLLVIFFVLMTIYSLTAGLAGNAFMTIVAKVMPVQRRGSFFGWREFAGTAMGLLAGYVVAVALSPARGLVFPDNFGFIFVVAFGAIGAGLLIFTLTREPRETITSQGMTFSRQLHAARGIVSQNHSYRRYLLTRFVLAAADLATPFYAIYATQQPGCARLHRRTLYRIYDVLGTARHPGSVMDERPSKAALGHAHRRRGDAHHSPFGIALWRVRRRLGRICVWSDFYRDGVARTAANIGFPTYLLNIAPPEQRTLYIGFTNTMLGIATFIPIIGGILLDLFGFTLLFVITFLMSSLGLWLALGLVRKPRQTETLRQDETFPVWVRAPAR